MQKVNELTFSRRDDLSAADILKLPWPQLRSLIDVASPSLKRQLLEHGIVYFYVAMLVYEKNDPVLIEKLLRFRFTRHLGKNNPSMPLILVPYSWLLADLSYQARVHMVLCSKWWT